MAVYNLMPVKLHTRLLHHSLYGVRQLSMIPERHMAEWAGGERHTIFTQRTAIRPVTPADRSVCSE